jgi:hypothetical protein
VICRSTSSGGRCSRARDHTAVRRSTDDATTAAPSGENATSRTSPRPTCNASSAAGHRVPDPHHAIVAAGRHERAIGRERRACPTRRPTPRSLPYPRARAWHHRRDTLGAPHVPTNASQSTATSALALPYEMAVARVPDRRGGRRGRVAVRVASATRISVERRVISVERRVEADAPAAGNRERACDAHDATLPRRTIPPIIL